MGLNSPLPVRLEEETRKAAKILRSFVDVNNNGLDKVIPRHVLERAAGFVIFTVIKAGFVFSARAGSGIVIARLDDGSWSPPSAIGLGGFGFGGQMGAEVTDFLIVLNSRSAVTSFMSAGNLTLGGNLSVAVGPLGRNAEGSGAVNTKGRLAAMYSYSKTKGLFGGVSVEGSVIVERQDANRLAYGGNPNAKQILSGTFDPPDWAGVLIDQLNKATGLPGGQRWINKDEEGEGEAGGMGWSSPKHDQYNERDRDRGYVFGQGVGANGNTPPPASNNNNGRRSRASSLFGNNNNNNQNQNGSPLPNSNSPQRPTSSRKGSSFNPFSSSGSNSPRRNPLEHSSENYSAGIGGSTPTGGRSRSGSVLKNGEVPPPFSFMNSNGKSNTPPNQSQRDKDLLGDWDSSMTSSATNDAYSSINSNTRTNRKISGGEKDLLGAWESNGTGLSAQFSNLRTSSTSNSNSNSGKTTRGRSNSKPTPFNDISEHPSSYEDQREYDYTPRETESKFANMDWSSYPSTSNIDTNGNGNGNGNGNRNGSSSTFVSIASGRKQSSSSPTKSGGKNNKNQRPVSSYISPPASLFNDAGSGFGYADNTRRKDFSPFEDLPVGRLRSDSNEDGSKPFESYLHLSKNQQQQQGQGQGRNSTSGNGGSPRPDLKLKEGLNTDFFQGYARAIGLFDFNGSAQGDLGFKSGQVIIILDKIGDNGDWWKGVSPTTGKSGIFPSNYVEVIELPKNHKGGVSLSELRKRVGGNEFDQ
ncbi:uncharacterized protein IL334_006113 [Kwoniella shivajii]|uniref:SH3 domain-containing protein n=1 Tax=Kwoniella shivajii TaxID=564305 RepID=A0ABZ1D510_9TREE|nr:hypothetical protein IL334_006113 [Kwoniella shivajii]